MSVFKYINNIIKNIDDNRGLIFVNGELYTGYQIHNVYKGVGWNNGRTISVQLKDVSSTSGVYLVNLSFGKLRKLKFIKQSNSNWDKDPDESEIPSDKWWEKPKSAAALEYRYSEWDVIEMPQDRN